MTLSEFLLEWKNDNPRLLVHTSGSTGPPKPLWVEKRRMEASARMTCDFLGLKANDTALLCMPLDFIAGKMMVVRALVCGMQIVAVKPSGRPLQQLVQEAGYKKIDFAAMVPMQVFQSLQQPEERRILREIKHLIIGGGAVDENLERELADFPNAVWSTYGMTETLSHVALRRLNGSRADIWYTPMANVTVELDGESCLVIDAPCVCDQKIFTNDVAELHEDGRRFRILGRKDNVICSGGIKIQAEKVEQKLIGHLAHPFVVTRAKDVRFGEVVVLLTESPDLVDVQRICAEILPKFWQPRLCFHVLRLPLTGTGKVARAEAERMANDLSRLHSAI